MHLELCYSLLKCSLHANKILKNWLIDSLELFIYFNIIIFALFTAYNLSTGGNQDGIAYTSVVLSILVTIFILLYHFYVYTWLFKDLHNSKYVTNFKSRKSFNLKSEPQFNNKESQPSITDLSNSIRRHDDILDITNPLTRDAEYHIIENFMIENRQQPTRSVDELS